MAAIEPDGSDAWAQLDFVEQYHADRQAGVERTLEEYLESNPERASVIRQFFPELRQREPEGGADQAIERNPPAVGEARIGRYRLQRELGRGGQGVVYLAVDEHLQREVALKVLVRSVLDTQATLLRFQREAKVASRLQHPGICTVYDAGIEDAGAYIAMQYLAGESLARRLARWNEQGGGRHARGDSESKGTSAAAAVRQHVRVAVRIVRQAARALHAAHEAGVIHRDVKPGNLMLTEGDEPVLLDFGLARDAASQTLTLTGDLFGTPAYMSPEQLAGGPLDRRTDLWSLGVVLYECLTLQRPFSGPTREALARAIRKEEPPDLGQILLWAPRDLRTIVTVCLSKELPQRYQTAADLACDLDAFLDGRPIAARPLGPGGRLLRWLKREPLKASLAAVLVVALPAIASLATYIVTTRPEVELARQFEARAHAEEQLELAYRELGDWTRPEEQQAVFEHALSLLPGSLEAVAGLARLHLLRDDPALALQLLETWQELEGSASHRLLRRDALIALGRSVEDDVAAADVAPRDAIDFYLLAERELDRGHGGDRDAYRRAWELHEQAVLHSPHQRRLYLYQRAHIAGHLGDAGRAQAVAATLRSSWPEVVAARHWAGIALQGSGLMAAAEIEFGHAAQLAPDKPQFLCLHAEMLAACDRWPEAEQQFQRALALGDHAVRVRVAFGRSLVRRHALAEAEKLLRGALAIDADDPEALQALGHALNRAQRWPEARECYERALRIRPDAATHASLGTVHLRQNELDAAIAEYQRAVDLDPAQAEAWYNMGLAWYRKGRWSDAEAAQVKALELDPLYPGARTSLGATLRMLGQPERARTCLEEAVRRDPADAVACYHLGIMARQRGDLAQAEGYYRQGLRAQPRHQFALAGLAEVLWMTARRAAAVEHFRAALATNPGDATSVCLLGRTLAELGRFGEALPLLQRGHELASALPWWNLPSEAWLRECQRSLQLTGELATLDQGAAVPGDAGHALELAAAALRTGRAPLALRLYRAASTAAPDLAAASDVEHPLLAARATALVLGAATHDGEDRALRAEALRWLQTGLATWRRRFVEGRVDGPELARRLQRWQGEPDLTAIRAPESLALLDAEERGACSALWQEIDRLVGQLRQP